jgi:hypothetical protein
MTDRHARQSNAELTPMQQVVVDEVRRGRSWTAAAREAGYADPSGEVDRLKANPAILDAIIGPLQEKAASWELLSEKVRRVLDRNMDDCHRDWCRSLKPADEVHGFAPCNCPFAKLKPADANAAAKIASDILSRTDPDTLAKRARHEDAAISDTDAAKLFLGTVSPEGDGPVN